MKSLGHFASSLLTCSVIIGLSPVPTLWTIHALQSTRSSVVTRVSKPFEAHLVGSFVTEISQAVHYDVAKPALELAVEEANRRFPAIKFDLVVKNDSDTCFMNVAGGLVAEEYYNERAHAFIGPACDLALDQVGRMAAYWKVPVFTAGGIGVQFNDKSIYSTLTRLAFSLDRISHFFVQIFRENDWHHISMIVDETDLSMTLVRRSLEYMFKVERELNGYDIKFDIQTFQRRTGNNTVDFRRHLKESAKKARVILLITAPSLLRDILLDAYDLGMGTGDYVFFGVELIKSKEADGGIGWYKLGDRRNKEAKYMFETLMIISVRVPVSNEYNTFVYEVAKKANEGSANNQRYSGSDVNPIVAAFYDSVLMYGWALNKTLADGDDPNDGHAVVRKVWGKTFYQGLTGDIMINSNGDREADYTLNDLDPDTGIMRPVATYYGAKRTYEKMPGIEILWAGGAKTAPADVPLCGFEGNHVRCQEPAGAPVGAILSAIFIVLLGICGTAFYFVQKKLKLETDLADQWWKLNYEELRFPEGRGQSRTGKSTTSSLGLSVASFGSKGSRSLRPGSMATSMNTTIANIHGVDCALYRGLKVAVKNVHFNGRLHLNRQVCMELKDMREVKHDNLVKFTGICIEEPNTCIVSELCVRGSLRDMLENESVAIDWLFRYAMMNDIVEGMFFLHSSPIEYHGHLKSTNLVIDGRFTVKICDYGLRSVYEQFKHEDHTNPRTLFWTAPEHLREADPMKAGSKKGDVYSFAIILQELITRQGPFEGVERLGRKKETHDPDEILDRLRMGANPPFRPQVAPDECMECPDILGLMNICWAENPGDRPDFSSIKPKLKKITRGVNSKNFLDNLLKRLEQYSNSLEAIVAEKTETLVEEKARAEELVHNMLPPFIAEELKQGRHVMPESFDSVTIYFSDVIGFAALAMDSGPHEVVDLLNDIYGTIDAIIGNYNVYKVETIADAYLIASGVPIRNGNEHAREMARMALDIRIAMRNFRARHDADARFQIRAGIHSGSCVAGVIGLKMPKYCLFGDTINTASRMETNGEAGKIHISPITKSVLDMFGGFIMIPRGEVEIKGKGKIKTFWLEGEERSYKK